MTATEQGELIGFISKIAPGTYADEELDEWAHTTTPLELSRSQWEPCVRAWRFTDPPRSGNHLAALYARLKDIATQFQRTAAPEIQDDGYMLALRLRLAPVQSASYADRLAATSNLSPREVVIRFWLMQALKSQAVYGYVHRAIVHDAATDIRNRCGFDTTRDAMDALARCVGEPNATAWMEERRDVHGKATRHRRGMTGNDLAGELAAAHNARPQTDKTQRQRVCDELSELSTPHPGAKA